MTGVSAVLITLNEEADIARALGSVRWCDEIIVVDSGSTDRTVQICLDHGCKVVTRPFNGYGEQKRFAVDQARFDWILSIDADEEVTPELQREMIEELSKPSIRYGGFFVPISLVLWDGAKRRNRRYVKPKLRLFNKRVGKFKNLKVHETVEMAGPTKPLNALMYNYAYSSIFDYFQKFNLYTTAAAEQCFSCGQTSPLPKIVSRFPLEFFRLYVLRGFALDGWNGFVWSFFSALYPVVKYIKLHECKMQSQWALAQVNKERAKANVLGTMSSSNLARVRDTV